MSGSPKTQLWLTLILFLGIIVLFLSSGVSSAWGVKEAARNTQARNDVMQIVAAAKQYYLEYGKYPPIGFGEVTGTPEDQARFFRILYGKDAVQNPRNIQFYEARTARQQRGKFRGGFHPVTGVLLDPWGNPYRIIVDADNDGKVLSPYEDEKGTPFKTGVIAWSLGKDGLQSPSLRNGKKRSDDNVSWE